MNDLLKEELYHLIDACNDETLLQRVKALLIGDAGMKNWWDELEDGATGTETLVNYANLIEQHKNDK